MNKVISILEAKVNEQNWDILQNAYRTVKENKSGHMPLQSFLLQMTDDPKLWRIISVWESIEVLQKMKSSGETPTGILIFRKADADPNLSIFEAKEEI